MEPISVIPVVLDPEASSDINIPSIDFGHDPSAIILGLLERYGFAEGITTNLFVSAVSFLNNFLEKKSPHADNTTDVTLDELESCYYYSRLANGIYGWKYLSILKFDPFSFIKGTIQGDAEDLKTFLAHTELLEAQVLDMQWIGDHFDPAHCVFIDHSNKRIGIIIRGTLELKDCVSDAVCEYEPFAGGKGHKGMIQSAINKWKKIEPIIVGTRCLDEYELRITGHSLGAGVASLMTIIWKERHPDSNVKCWTYGCPPVVDYDLSRKYCDCITAMIAEDDIVSRLSLGALYDLKNKIMLLSSKMPATKLFAYASLLSVSVGQASTKKTLLKTYQLDMQALLDVERHEKLFVPGKILHFMRSGKDVHVDVIPPTSSYINSIYKIELPNLTDHWLGVYEDFLKAQIANRKRVALMSSHTHDFVDVWFTGPTWCYHCEWYISWPKGKSCTVCSVKIHSDCLK